MARREVREAVEHYVAVSRTVNADSIAAFFAPNGVLFEPGIAPNPGADSIRSSWRRSLAWSSSPRAWRWTRSSSRCHGVRVGQLL